MSAAPVGSPPPVLLGYALGGLAWLLGLPSGFIWLFGGAAWVTQASGSGYAKASPYLPLAVIGAVIVFGIAIGIAFKARSIIEENRE